MIFLLLILIFGIPAILMFYYAYVIGIRKNIKVINDYHVQHVKQENVNSYLKTMAIGFLVIGITFLLQVGIICLFKHAYINVLLPVMFTGIGIGIGVMVYAQYKYNGGIFS